MENRNRLKCAVCLVAIIVSIVDAQPPVIWERVLDFPGATIIRYVIETQDHGYFLAGTGGDSVATHFFLAKTDSLANVEWARSYQDDRQIHIEWSTVMEDGGYACAGYTWERNQGGILDAYLRVLRVDSSGEVLWERLFSKPYRFMSLKGAETIDGGLLLVEDLGDIFRISQNGDSMWARNHGLWHIPTVFLQSDGSFVVAGTNGCGMSAWSASILHIDDTGNALSCLNDQFSGRLDIHTTIQTESGFAFCGAAICADTCAHWNGTILTTDNELATENIRLIYVSDYNIVDIAHRCPDGGFVLAGRTGGSDYDAWTLKLAANLDLVWGPTLYDGIIVPSQRGGYFSYWNVGQPDSIYALRLSRLADDLEVFENSPVLQHFTLHQNYPNPFNPTTEIHFELVHESSVSLRVFDITGREVATLIDGNVSAGEHKQTFDARALASGIYFYRLDASGLSETKKMVVLK